MDRIYEGWKRFSEAFPRDSLDGTWAIDWEYFGDFFFLGSLTGRILVFSLGTYLAIQQTTSLINNEGFGDVE